MLVDHNYRLELLETILKWEGRLNNSRVREIFALGGTRASEWIKEFREIHPDWMVWDSVTRSFHATSVAYLEPQRASVNNEQAASLAQYLSLVGISHITTIAPTSPDLWSAYPDISVPAAHTFAQISEAIRLGKKIEVTYRSMLNPIPHQRVISPHSLVRAGRRWHVRAFCSVKKEFRDYALGRIEAPKVLGENAEKQSRDDKAWSTMIKVTLIAHPGLNLEQQKLVQFEYFANTSARVTSCRAALISYFIQDVRAATNIDRQKPPEYQLAIGNPEEIKPWLFPG